MSTTTRSLPAPVPAHLSALLRLGRWLQTRSFGFTPEQIGVSEGLRAAAAVGIMVSLVYITGNTLFGWGAFAAFWNCLADPAGPVRRRLLTMGGFTLAGTIVGPVMSCSAAQLDPWAVLPLLFVVVCLANAVRFWGQAAGQAGLLVGVVAVVAVDQPAPLAEAPYLACMFLAGGALAVFICAVIWPIHPFQPARRALKAVFRDLKHMAGALQAGPHERTGNRWAVRTSIERARALIEKTAACRRKESIALEMLTVLDAADEIFGGLIALEHACGKVGAPNVTALLTPLHDALARAETQALRIAPGWGCITTDAEALAELAAASEGLVVRIATLWARALGRISVARALALGSDAGGAAQPAPGRTAARAALRHGLRVAFMVLAAYVVTLSLGLPYAYWATMAVIVVMQPLAETTWPRMLERCIGSLVGGVIAAVLTQILAAPWELVLIAVPMAALTIALRTVNYTLFTLFLTPLFVLVAALINPGHGWGLALDRAGCNVLGSLLGAFGAFYLWRESQARPFAALLADAVAANTAYYEIVSKAASIQDVEAARRQAGLASGSAEEALQRASLEGHMSRSARTEAEAQLIALRRLAGEAAVKWLEKDVRPQ